MKNVVLITLDSWRADHLSEEITPNIWRFAQGACIFENAFACGPSTSFSFPAILGSLYATTCNRRINRSWTTIDELLQQHGYSTSVIHSDVVYLEPFFGYYDKVDWYKGTGFGPGAPAASGARGRDTSSSAQPQAAALGSKAAARWMSRVFEFVTRYRLPWAESVLRTGAALPRLWNGRKLYEADARLHQDYVAFVLQYLRDVFQPPGFVHLHSVIPHPYYCVPEGLRSKFGITKKELYRQSFWMKSGVRTGFQRRQMKTLYRGAAAFADEFVGRVLATLEQRSLLRQSVVVISADHGEALFERGYFGHSQPIHSYDTLLRVPLVIYDPGLAPRRVTEPVTLLDLPPTLADLCGLQPPKGYQGTSLASAMRGQPDRWLQGRLLFSESWHLYHPLSSDDYQNSPISSFTVRNGKYKLKSNRRFDQHWEELFQWQEDPLECCNVSRDHPAIVKDLRDALETHLAKQRRRRQALDQRDRLAQAVQSSVTGGRQTRPLGRRP